MTEGCDSTVCPSKVIRETPSPLDRTVAVSVELSVVVVLELVNTHRWSGLEASSAMAIHMRSDWRSMVWLDILT